MKTAVDLFSGAGGLALGLKRAGFSDASTHFRTEL